MRPSRQPIAIALGVTLAVAALSRLVPEQHSASAVAAAFLAATWLLVLRRDGAAVREHGLSLGGLFEPEPLAWRRLGGDALIAIGYALAAAAVTFPLYSLAFGWLWAPGRPFALRLPPHALDLAAGQLLVIALPEEAFFRGYLQSALDRRWRPRWRVVGAVLGPAWLVSAAIFAAGHVLTDARPARLAVFFPALAFGWLRARTRGIGAGLVFHASCNLLSLLLASGYGLPGH